MHPPSRAPRARPQGQLPPSRNPGACPQTRTGPVPVCAMGQLRVERTERVFDRCDLGVLVTEEGR